MRSAQLKDIRAFDPERQGRWSFSSQQATLRRLDKAFAAFFRRIKSGETPGCPRFRGVNWFDTVEFPKDGDGCRWDATPYDPQTRVRFQGVGHVKVKQHRPVVGKVKTVAPKPDPPQPDGFLPDGASAKTGLNRSIPDAGWGVFLTILHAKAESAGREVIAVDPRNTSRTCPECGHISVENRPTQERFHCTGCGRRAHADVVGASNVLRAGLARRQAQPA
ncbi:RNA-guided endonuclease InsQ/TnpB family protein [Streptomyces sp. enrichment culture]|uniref:RNA-guided endonuclease InsQ/TnpB family protein n=1 Tax=Streptomyces sp. enrichment culture TaxID=1795815 RepID=UPI003F55516D